jgi:hypothetical protein
MDKTLSSLALGGFSKFALKAAGRIATPQNPTVPLPTYLPVTPESPDN